MRFKHGSSILFSQDMDVCELKGRDCIDKNSIKTYDCSTTCVGIYADVQWREILLEEEKVDREAEIKLQGEGGKFQQQLVDLIRMEVMKMKKSEKGHGEEVDKDKYKMMVAEYRKFKEKNVKHFRLNVGANSSSFGKKYFATISI